MKTIFYIMIFLLICPSASSAGITADGNRTDAFRNRVYARSWAVVVGINEYQYLPKLAFAVNDARAVAALLVDKFGFSDEHIVRLFDQQATKDNLLKTLGDDLPFKIGLNDRLLIFYAGHGETRNNVGYLLPVNSREGRYRSTAISMTELKEILKEFKCKHIYLVLDACYSGMFFTTRSIAVTPRHPRYIEEITTRKARQALTAGGKEPVADGGGEQRHSIFTGAFLDALETGAPDFNGDQVITASEIASYLLPKVSNLSQQTPEYGQLPGSEGGEFVFFLGKQPTFSKKETVVLPPAPAVIHPEYQPPPIVKHTPPVYIPPRVEVKNQSPDQRVQVLTQDNHQIVIQVSGDPPSEGLSALGKKTTALKNAKRMATGFLQNHLSVRDIDYGRLEIQRVDYDARQAATVTFVYPVAGN